MNKLLSFFLIFNVFCQGTEHTNWFNFGLKISILALGGANLYLLNRINSLEEGNQELAKNNQQLNSRINTLQRIFDNNYFDNMPREVRDSNQRIPGSFDQMIKPYHLRISTLESQASVNTILNLTSEVRQLNQKLKSLSDRISLIEEATKLGQPIDNRTWDSSNTSQQIREVNRNLLKTQTIMLDALNILVPFSEELHKRNFCQQYHKNNLEICREALKKQIEQTVSVNTQPRFTDKNFSFSGLFKSNKNEN